MRKKQTRKKHHEKNKQNIDEKKQIELQQLNCIQFMGLFVVDDSKKQC